MKVGYLCTLLGQNFFISGFTKPDTVIFWKVEKNLFFFLFYLQTLNICFE